MYFVQLLNFIFCFLCNLPIILSLTTISHHDIISFIIIFFYHFLELLFSTIEQCLFEINRFSEIQFSAGDYHPLLKVVPSADRRGAHMKAPLERAPRGKYAGGVLELSIDSSSILCHNEEVSTIKNIHSAILNAGGIF